MSAGSAFALFAAVVLVIVAVVLFVAGRQARKATEEGQGHDPQLVRELTDELKKTRAEEEHWRRTAERLQRELDRRE